MLKKRLIALAILAGICFLLTYPKIYVVREAARGEMYWNSGEALLFMRRVSSGARVTPLRYALEGFLASLGSVRSPDDKTCSELLVIRVTDKDLQRYETDLNRHTKERYCGFGFDLFKGQIYAVEFPMLSKWVGTHFESSTPEEDEDFTASVSLRAKESQKPWEFNNVDGWSMREFGATTPKYEFALRGQPVTILFSGRTWPRRPLSVDLIRSGQPTQRIWTLDEGPRVVNKAEYEKIFAKP